MGTPAHILFVLVPGMALHTEEGTGLGWEVDMDLGLVVGSFLGLTPGTEENTHLELVVDIYLGRGPDMRRHTPPQLVPGTFLGPFEDMGVAHMVVCTVDH